ncbi:TPA_asm: hypothetical protein [Porphyromonas phage phage018a_AFR5B1]|uniref:Uncharacterized protein n=1 Tax=Porphyromonas phage phage018a_AFR5B1 TaxID=3154108 RepID=A0AAT9JBW9_9CAUD
MHTTDQTQIPRSALAIPRRRARRLFRQRNKTLHPL